MDETYTFAELLAVYRDLSEEVQNMATAIARDEFGSDQEVSVMSRLMAHMALAVGNASVVLINRIKADPNGFLPVSAYRFDRFGDGVDVIPDTVAAGSDVNAMVH